MTLAEGSADKVAGLQRLGAGQGAQFGGGGHRGHRINCLACPASPGQVLIERPSRRSFVIWDGQ